MGLKQEFPGLKVVSTPAGFLVKCSCYEARRSGVRRYTYKAATIPEIRRWVAAHEHGFETADEAQRECSRMAREASREVDKWLAAEFSRPT